ncbi:MAG: NUDIX domain-containing protein [Planctomycetes bacterium]|nr:NUDIX domain-containing protein [Planctomycetota bacterium]
MANNSGFILQGAALPIRNGRVCLVTSSNGKRWVIPKGQIEPGQTAGETALQEAWEEAGLVGVLGQEPVGSYLYEKWCGVCHVTVFVMQVTKVVQDWPEREIRQRVWLSVGSALERIDDPGLADILRQAMGKPIREELLT